jgi:hypothetical protein
LPAPVGRFYFEVAIGARRRGYRLAAGFFTPAFVKLVRRHQDGAGAPTERNAYQVAKHDLIGRLLGAPDDVLFHDCDVPA